VSDLLRKLAAQVLTQKGEFAPGIPAARRIEAIPRVKHTEPQTWGLALQKHEAERAGEHADLRLVDNSGRAHSWAVPKGSLPSPGQKFRVIPQPTHTQEYAERKGTFEISEGYGKGRVTSEGVRPVEVVRSQPGLLRFNLYGGPKEGNQEFALVTTPKGALLHNITATSELGVRGQGGHEIPAAKPKYREIPTDRVSFDDPLEVHQAKVDGAHVTFHLRGGKGVKIFSYRPTERATGVLEHTHKVPGFRELKAPPGLAGTVLRGELYGAEKETGRSLPAEQTGGLLNATVWRSRERQQELGAELKPVIFDVVRYKGRPMEDAPYAEKLKVLQEVQRKVPRLQIPPMATTPAEKSTLLSRIQSGEEPITSEGIVSWRLDQSRPTKAKFRPDVDAEIVGFTGGKGKHEGRIGALQVRLPGKDAVTNVGTGLSDDLRRQIAENPDAFVGRTAKVRTQQVFPSGKLRAPSFAGFHLEKGKQSFEEKTAASAQPKGIKFLYLNTGGGHKAQAEALAEAAKKMGIPAETVSWSDRFSNGPYAKQYEQAYTDFLHGKKSQLGLAVPATKFSLMGTDHDKLRKWVDENKDQAVVVTMAHLRKEFKGIDHPVHILHSDPVKIPFATGGKTQDRIDIGLPSVLRTLGAKTRIAIPNLPVSQKVLRPKGTSGLIDKKNFNITVSSGSLGPEIVPITKQVLEAGLPEDAVVHAVAGKNTKALKELQRLAKEHPQLHPHGFAPLSNMMRESDLNVIRAHGTTFAETVAAGKPAVYYGPDVGFLRDGQGDLTKRTAIYGGKHIGNPVAVGLDAIPGAVNTALKRYDRLKDKAREARQDMGDPATLAVQKIMKARPGYVVKAASIEPRQLRAGTPIVGDFDTFAERLKPGDVLLTKPSEHAKLESSDRALKGAVKVYDWLSGAKHPGWAHTALYLGDGQIAHLHDKKLRRGRLVSMGEGINRVVTDKLDVFKAQGYDIAAVRPRVKPSVAQSAATQMREFAATPADISMGKFTRNILRTGLTPLSGASVRDAVCSGIVGEAFPTPLAKRPAFSMRPKDFLESKKVQHVVGYSPDEMKKAASALRAIADQTLSGRSK